MSKILKFRGKRTEKNGLWPATVIFSSVIGGVLLYMFLPLTSAPDLFMQPGTSVRFGLCHTGGGINCVVDGDTFWMDGKDIRVADIDAPETHPPRCRYEAELGNRATLRLQELLNEGPVQLEAVDRDIDIYGRELRVVTRNGESLGLKLVDEDLARKSAGFRRPWC